MRTVEGGRVPIRMWADPDSIEDAALGQLRNASNLPWIHGVAVMPDVHYGKGATVGSVLAMRDAVSPAAVGVDIGCGMSAVRTSLTAADLPDDLGRLRRRIESAVPVGFAMHETPVNPDRVPGTGGWDDFWARFAELHPDVQSLRERARRQIGSLGGGNHFIEVCLEQGGEDAGRVWLMLHSGSRGIGNELAKRHIDAARGLPHNADLPDPDLAVFVADTPEMAAYRGDLFWAQEYAARNRATMVALVQSALAEVVPGTRFDEPISCHHNYVAEETFDGVDVLVTRKGAIRAGSGEMGIIPGSMGTGSYIVRGLGNPESFRSASHGAGRRMSRRKAKKTFSADDLAAQTAGVECRKDGAVVDEIPSAYKDIDAVIRAQRDLVEVVAQLKQVVCVKG
ncbi:RtcB family protein [Saccharopolyspora halophila]|uniref:3'-phosphate/5'-hydroxy nucleic acid ligase n=1 Tax=Saccharopolyspora halophila TaxID=405551 RepID=A0ABP5TUB9_9PSEU